jgi:hypothetical protein
MPSTQAATTLPKCGLFPGFLRGPEVKVPDFATGGFTFTLDNEVVLIPCSSGG